MMAGPSTSSQVTDAETQSSMPTLEAGDLLSVSSETLCDSRNRLVHDEIDLFKPFPPVEGALEEKSILTFRAVVAGVLSGVVVNSANVYMGLKAGLSGAGQIFGALFGYAVIKVLTKAAPQISWLGRREGPKEILIVMATMMSAASTSGNFTSVVPAMFAFGILETPSREFGRMITLTFIGGFFGLFLAAALHEFLIVRKARKLRLRFPSSEAMAAGLRTSNAAGSHATKSVMRLKVMAITFLASLIQSVASSYAVGILYDWHVFTWIYIWGDYSNSAIAIESWGWYFEFTPFFIGLGMLLDLKIAVSMFAGTVIAWGVMGPILVHYGICVGIQQVTEPPEWAAWKSYIAMHPPTSQDEPSSPRYWLLWPGITMMMGYSLAELLLQVPTVIGALKQTFISFYSTRHISTPRARASDFVLQEDVVKNNELDRTVEVIGSGSTIPAWTWLSGMAIVTLVACVVSRFQYGINAGLAVLSLVAASILSFVCIIGMGTTNLVPDDVTDRSSQLIFGGITHAQQASAPLALSINLFTGAVVSSAASMASTSLADYRGGFLLGIPARTQFYAQLIGAILSIFVAPGVFILYTTAYPCVLQLGKEPASEKCSLTAPGMATWVAVAEAVTQPSVSIPPSSGIFAYVIAGVAAAQVLVERYLLDGVTGQKIRRWLPNWMAMGVGFVIPGTHYTTAILIGALLVATWRRWRPGNYNIYGMMVAVGCLAGEALGTMIQAVLQVVGVGGSVYGTGIGCPANVCI